MYIECINPYSAEGLMARDDNGVPTTACIRTDDKEANSVELCPVTDGSNCCMTPIEVGPQPIGCYSVWNGTNKLLSSECKERVCTADFNGDGLVFCCCFGLFCNA
ncbi:hypothetical protein PRIPAC_96203 [Pristionchus pacificus]|uniref:Uncharacterized protein n=1 Tax=Pristionchus pacificus TaxID=54126 RepID=A0A2A6D2U0_PRIPA|nr:hypothetical protein PRIPAC_96203 [Pristionchus pacificus]|eukprot:PDM84725.1 hypothetical protein PRIPAC_33748 [Pristionchus pacificus]